MSISAKSLSSEFFLFSVCDVAINLRGVYSDATQLNSTELNSGQMPVYDVINKNTTDLLRADWLYAVQLG